MPAPWVVVVSGRLLVRLIWTLSPLLMISVGPQKSQMLVPLL